MNTLINYMIHLYKNIKKNYINTDIIFLNYNDILFHLCECSYFSFYLFPYLSRYIL